MLSWMVAGVPTLGWHPVPLFLLTVPVSVVLSARRYGFRGASVYWLISIVISNFWEDISVAYGFPFGNYHYTLGPKIFFVPFFVGPIYASLGYLSWIVANWILGQADRKIGKMGNLFMLPLVSGAVMTMWDVVTDPQASTFGGTWIWQNGGDYFGVPVSNFLGWWFVTYCFYQAFAIYIWKSRRPVPEDTSVAGNLVPILLYGGMGLSVIEDFMVGGKKKGPVTDALGVTWRYDHLLGTMTVVTLFTMVFAALIALHRWREARAEGQASS